MIGTNGAGKSTLINLLSGELAASGGSVVLDGTDVTGWAQPRRARAGIGRSYQRTTIFPEFSAFENCRLSGARPAHATRRGRSGKAAPSAAHSGRRGAARRARRRRPRRPRRPPARPALLSHGGQRQLEIAMCLATSPRVLLLDEPLAGMGAEEAERMLALLASLKPGHAVLLIEHDMDAVFRVAERITVMVDGRVIASDVPRAHPQQSRRCSVAYLGDAAH